jgi:hypothetical protein
MAQAFEKQDMTGAIFREVSLRDAVFDGVDLAGARVVNPNLKGCSITGGLLYQGMTILGIPVLSMLDAELDRRDPERARLHTDDPHDPEIVRGVAERLEALRSAFRATLRSAPPDLLRRRPEEKRWSAIEHLRHLVFAEEIDTNRVILRNEDPFSKLGLLPDMWAHIPEFAGVGTEPSEDLEVILAAWDKIHSRTTAFLHGATGEELSRVTGDFGCGPGTVGRVINDAAHHDLEHIRFAEAALSGDPSGSRFRIRWDFGIRWE